MLFGISTFGVSQRNQALSLNMQVSEPGPLGWVTVLCFSTRTHHRALQSSSARAGTGEPGVTRISASP